MTANTIFRLAVAMLALSFSSTAAHAQSVYSYVDESGVRVFTNIPPKNATAPVVLRSSGEGQAAATFTNTPPKSPPPVSDGDRTRRGSTQTPTVRPDYDPLIERYSKQHKLDPALVKSIIATESAFNPRAVSRKGARGLMQLMPGTAAKVGVRNVFDAEDNIRGGTQHLRTLFDIFGNDLVLVLAAYNAGENLVQRIGRIPDFRETHDYVRLVTTRYGKRAMNVPAPETPPRPAMFRYLDANGVLHLTNLPPVQRGDVGASNVGSAP